MDGLLDLRRELAKVEGLAGADVDFGEARKEFFFRRIGRGVLEDEVNDREDIGRGVRDVGWFGPVDGGCRRRWGLVKEFAEKLDVVVGSRNKSGGSMGAFSAQRVRLSNLGRRISSLLSRVDISDPMSGFFIISRAYLDEVVRSLSAVGFKVLLDLLASSQRPVRFGEVGYTFRNRQFGESKLTLAVCLEYVELVLDKMVGDWIPVRYAFFGLVGAIGVVAQFVLVRWMNHYLPFLTAQIAGSVIVMILNYFLNNRLTFRARRLQGWAWVGGLAGFMVACSIGLFWNLSVVEGLRRFGAAWGVASLAGVVAGSVWNYGVSSMLVWRVNRRRRRALAAPRPAEIRPPATELS